MKKIFTKKILSFTLTDHAVCLEQKTIEKKSKCVKTLEKELKLARVEHIKEKFN